MSSLEESLRSLSLDYLNLLINGQAFSDVTFSVEGRLVHAHRCILAARSLFFRKFFCGPDQPLDPGGAAAAAGNKASSASAGVIPVNSVGYEVFLLLLQFLYSGQVSIVPQKHEPRPNCGERACWHTHCSSAVDLALDTLSAARSFGVEQLALLTQKQLESMVEKASIEDVMKVLVASRKQDMNQLWTTCSHLVAKSGLPPEVLAKHLPIDVVAKIEDLRLKSATRRHVAPHHHHHHHNHFAGAVDQKIRRMRRALDSSDVELVKLMVMGEGLNLDHALALHYAVENCSREVVKALLELGAADVNFPAGPAGKTPLHVASEMVSPDIAAVLLDHHADPNSGPSTASPPSTSSGPSPPTSSSKVPSLASPTSSPTSSAFASSSSSPPPSSCPAKKPNNNNNNNNSSNNDIGYIPAAAAMSEDGQPQQQWSVDSRLVYLNLGAAAAGTGTARIIKRAAAIVVVVSTTTTEIIITTTISTTTQCTTTTTSRFGPMRVCSLSLVCVCVSVCGADVLISHGLWLVLNLIVL